MFDDKVNMILRHSVAIFMFVYFLQVVLLDLEVLSDISASTAGAPRHHSLSGCEPSDNHETAHEKLLNTYFTKFMINLLRMFSSDRKLLDDRGSFIIR